MKIKSMKGLIQRNNKNFWKDETDPEDQLMEDFTFGVAKRRLGVLLNYRVFTLIHKNYPYQPYIN